MEVSGELHVPGRFTPEERIPGTHWIGGWKGATAGLGAGVQKGKSLSLTENQTSAVQPAATPTEL
jgi:hypothetical protein